MTEETKRGRGRPRPQFTVQRDAQVLEYLTNNGPSARTAIADAYGVNINVIYLSLNRLRDAGKVCRVRRGRRHLWEVTFRP